MQDIDSEILTVFLAATAIILLLIVLVVFFIVIYQRRVMVQKLQMQEIEADSQRQKLAAIVDTQEAERMRIARDLHDEVGVMLSTVKMSIKLAERRMAKAGLDQGLQEPSEMLDGVIASVRQISHDLLPPSLESLGLASALHALAEKTAAVSGIPFTCVVEGAQSPSYRGPARMPIRKELVIYRVVQELTANSLKHSQASRRSLRVTFTAEGLSIVFLDDGVGFDTAAAGQGADGLGLMGMRTRVESLGGMLTLHSAPGKGFEAVILLPS